MKHLYKMCSFMVLLAIGTTGCVDHEVESIKVNKPESIVLQEEIDSYAALKSYIDRDMNPNLKLGAGASLSDYMAKGVFYRLINRNFDEITLGYEMKHGAVVQEDGSLSLGNVEGLLAEAAAAGITVYGHTLAWHANQNAAYLNGLIAPIILPPTGAPALDPSVITNIDFEDGIDGWGGWGNSSTQEISADGEGYGGTGHAFVFTNPSVVNPWEAQVAFDFPEPLEDGAKYVLNLKVKGSVDGLITAGLQNPDDYGGRGDFGSFNVKEDWEEITLETSVTGGNAKRFLFSYGNYEGAIYIDDITLRRVNPDGGGPSLEENLFAASDFENGLGNWGGWGNSSTQELSADGEGYGGTGHAFVFTNPSAVNPWEAQVAYDFPEPLQDGSEYVLSFMVKGSIDGTISANFQNPDDYAGRGDYGGFNVTGDWEEVTLETKVLGDNAKRFLFNYGNYAGSIYIDDISIRRVNPEGGGVIEKNPEEKKEIIAEELERWIAGMLEVAKDHVKAWDVVNEPMDDGNPYELKTGVGRDLAADEFYWQDYLGKDYVVDAFRLAREYGNPDDIHFINDYNLEYNLDKCKGIIQLVEYIESQGETVHGIGTQMHIDINSDKGKIAEMFELLAATGKLIKVSELDIGLGGVSTNDATEEQYQAQAEMYQYVIEKYFEAIPANQRYGITIWSPLDSPADSFWRAGEPIGLWTEGFVRKPAYTGVANGLAD